MDKTPTHLDLFSGIGGFALAAKWAGFRTIAFCEIDKYCQKVLAKNFGAIPYAESERCGQGRARRPDSVGEGKSESSLPNVANASSEQDHRERRDSGFSRTTVGRNGKTSQQDNGQADHDGTNGCGSFIHSNIFDFDGTRYRGCDLLTGGFPCQPFSVAGKRRGAADDRAIWPEMFRVIKEARPAWILGENVPGIIPMELDNVLSDLESIGYACRPFVIPACAVDAKHRRDRVWIIGRHMADAKCGVQQSESWGCNETTSTKEGSSVESGGCGVLADAERIGQSGQGKSIDAINPKAAGNGETTQSWDGSRFAIWQSEPDVGGVVARLSTGMDGGLDEALRVLWQGNDSSEMVKRQIGRYVKESSFLFTALLRRLDYLSKQGATLEWSKKGTEKDSDGSMREMWLKDWFAKASLRQESFEQRLVEPQSIMPIMPQGRPLKGRNVGTVWLQEPNIPRVAKGVKERVNRLKGLGNAIVPQVAYEILREIRRLI